MLRSQLLMAFIFATVACNQLPEVISDGGDDDLYDASYPGLDSGVHDAGYDAGYKDAGFDAGYKDAGPGDAGFTGTPYSIPSQAPYDTWTWIPVENSYCGNGSPTGLGINPHQGSDKLLIFLAGGGMCFNYATCFVAQTASNLSGFGPAELNSDIGELDNEPGGLNRTDASNIFKDWNYVVLPYCTGDIFAGTHVAEYSDGLGDTESLYHVGHLNIGEYLQHLVPTFKSTATQIVFSGSSAGGYGALINYTWVANAFAPTPVLLIDDSGPPLRNPYLSTSLLSQIWDAWDMASAVPPGCTECNVDAGMSSLVPYLASNPSFRGVLLSAEQDEVIKDFMTVGNPLMYLGSYFQQGLYDLYDNVIENAGPGLFKAFFVDSSTHVWFVFRDPGQVVTDGTSLATFLGELITPDGGINSVVPDGGS